MAASIRDLKARSARARANAVRALPDALSTDCAGEDEQNEADEGPSITTFGLGFERLGAHPQHRPALEGLRDLAQDSDGFVRGLALIARGRLGDAALLRDYRAGTLAPDSQGLARWVRESAMLGLGELAQFSPPPPGVEHDDLLRCILEGLDDPAPEIRFQAVAVVADVAPSMVPELLPQRLDVDDEAEVRAQIYDVFLDRSDPPATVLDAARMAANSETTANPEANAPSVRESFVAARLLASLQDKVAAPRLLRGMDDRDERDDAIEAMAVLNPSDIPAEAISLALRLTRRWLVPPVTRVRAAYLIARVSPVDGGALLDRMARSARASVRDAVTDARAALAILAER